MTQEVRESAGGSLKCYELLVESTADAIIGADSTGRIVLWNEAAAAMFGYDRELIIGRPVAILISERFLRGYEKGYSSAILAGRSEVSHLSLEARHADGHEFPVEVAVSIAGSGERALAFGIVRQVSERFEKLAFLQDNERRLRDAEHLGSMGSFEWDVDGDSITWSDELYRIFGYEPGESPSTFAAFLERVHPDDRDAIVQNVGHAISSGSGWSMDERIIRKDTGEVRILATSVRAMLNARGKVSRLCGTCHDVTEQRRAEQALAASEARFRHGFDDAPIGMLLLDMRGEDGIITRTNKALSYLLGYSQAELTAMMLSQLVASQDWPLLLATLTGVLHDSSAPAQLEIRLHGADGRTPIVLAAAARIGAADSPCTLIVHLEDITERKHAEEQLRHRALHDSLTGLPNRDLLLDRLDGALARAARSNASVAVLFLDLDNFKFINDTIGHAAGDDMLRTVAKRIVAASRRGDTCARVGGDEFVMVCEDITHEDEVLSLARRVADFLAAPISICGSDFIATISIGIAVAHDRSHTPEELLRDADLAMYRAKQQGKNAIEIFDETLRKHAIDRVKVERELRIALQHDSIVPFYQPIVALETGKISGFEALARWHHPQRGLLSPNEFLSVAEETHLIGALGITMLRAACEQLATWSKIEPDLSMAVNLSLRQLDGHFPNALEACLKESGIRRSALDVEVTESVLLDMHKSAATDLRAIADLGVRLGIDDFGTGYSSLLYLKRFPVRFLKIDRSFVDGLARDPGDFAIVDAIIRLAQSLGLTTIAEGVEAQEQLTLLLHLGCSCGQGNFFAPPLPPAQCAELLMSRAAPLPYAQSSRGALERI